MNNIQNHPEHVKSSINIFRPSQSLTSEDSPFTCKEESLQWQIGATKCSCHSSWCESCWKRYGKKALVDRLQSMDWTRVRQVVLSVDPSLYQNGEEAYEDITHRRGIGNLIKNLERTDGIRIVDYAGSIEWHENGLPHWHIFIETEEEGKSGMIGHANIKRRWPYGIYVNESYIKSEEHWVNLTGYFNSHGYFEKGKRYQGVLPDWAMKSIRRIKRSFGMKQGHKRIKQGSRTRLNETSNNGEEFIKDLRKCENCNSNNSCETMGDGRGCRDVNEFSIKDTVAHFAKRRTYEMKLHQCGAKSRIEISGPRVYEGDRKHDSFVCNVPYAVLKELYPWQYTEGKGLVIELDEQGFQKFVEVLCFLADGECYEVRATEEQLDKNGAGGGDSPLKPSKLFTEMSRFRYKGTFEKSHNC